MKSKNKSILKGGLALAIFSALSLTSCKKEEVIVSPPVAGNEFMTTIKLRFENKNNPSDTTWAVWKDLTPDDQNAPDTSGAIINLDKNKTYKPNCKFIPSNILHAFINNKIQIVVKKNEKFLVGNL